MLRVSYSFSSSLSGLLGRQSSYEGCPKPLAYPSLGGTRNATTEFLAPTTEIPSDLAPDAHATFPSTTMARVLYEVWDPSPFLSRALQIRVPKDHHKLQQGVICLQALSIMQLCSLRFIAALALYIVPSHGSPIAFPEHKLEEINALRAEGVSEVRTFLFNTVDSTSYPWCTLIERPLMFSFNVTISNADTY